METTVKVSRVKRISATAKHSDLIILDLANGKPSVIRNAAQFLQDCKNSFLVDDNVNSMAHPSVIAVLRGLKRGAVSGDITHNKKGDTWVVTEDSSVFKDKSHPQYGKVSVGDKMPYLDDNTRVEGFLDIDLSDKVATRMANAEAIAAATVAADSVFDMMTVEVAVEEEPAPIPQSIIDNLGGAKDDKVVK